VYVSAADERFAYRHKKMIISHLAIPSKWGRRFSAIKSLTKPRWKLLTIGCCLLVIRSASGLVFPYTTKQLIDGVFVKHNEYLLIGIVGIVALAQLVQTISSFLSSKLLARGTQKTLADIRIRMFAHLSYLPMTFFDAHSSGELASRIMADVEGLQNLVGIGVVDFISALVTSTFALLILLQISASLTFTILFVIVSAMILHSHGLSTIKKLTSERITINTEVAGRLQESLSGIRTTKSLSIEDREISIFNSGIKKILRNSIASISSIGILGLSATSSLGILGCFVMAVGAKRVLGGTMTPGAYFQYTAVLSYMLSPVYQMVSIGTQLAGSLSSLDRTLELLSMPREIDDPTRKITLPPLDGNIIFENVSFSFEAGRQVIDNVSFTIHPGTHVAIVGSSGSGKTTIAALICAFYSATNGRVIVDGFDITTVKPASLRIQLCMVSQEPFLFRGTIRENICISLDEVTEERFRQVCHAARVDEFALRAPKGYETMIGERGMQLSGGQRQRISIARALLTSPRVLILDEATSALDGKNEVMVQERLMSLMKDRTVLVIAHRLSTMRNASLILVMEDGRIVERGTHNSLYAQKGTYYSLCKSQTTGRE
jgi:ABC-type multidrug transport system fused ATPase/permease subunit